MKLQFSKMKQSKIPNPDIKLKVHEFYNQYGAANLRSADHFTFSNNWHASRNGGLAVSPKRLPSNQDLKDKTFALLFQKHITDLKSSPLLIDHVVDGFHFYS